MEFCTSVTLPRVARVNAEAASGTSGGLNRPLSLADSQYCWTEGTFSGNAQDQTFSINGARRRMCIINSRFNQALDHLSRSRLDAKACRRGSAWYLHPGACAGGWRAQPTTWEFKTSKYRSSGLHSQRGHCRPYPRLEPRIPARLADANRAQPSSRPPTCLSLVGIQLAVGFLCLEPKRTEVVPKE